MDIKTPTSIQETVINPIPLITLSSGDLEEVVVQFIFLWSVYASCLDVYPDVRRTKSSRAPDTPFIYH
jgi:hypothetical protein